MAGDPPSFLRSAAPPCAAIPFRKELPHGQNQAPLPQHRPQTEIPPRWLRFARHALSRRRAEQRPRRQQIAGIREPEAGSGFVPQHAAADASATQRSATNRANAQHSTGPRSAEGKAASAQNAFKHGLSLQRHAVLEHEDPAQFDLLREELTAIYEPASPREHLALEEIAHCRWALRRFGEAEATLLEYQFAHDAAPTNDEDDYVSYAEALGFNCLREPGERPRPECASFLLLHRYRTHWDRRHLRALAEFDRACKDHRHQLRNAERREAAARKAEREAAAERRREELHQLRVALAQSKLAREQARASETKNTKKADLFCEAVASYWNNMSGDDCDDDANATTTPEAGSGFVPQNPATTEDAFQTSHTN